MQSMFFLASSTNASLLVPPKPRILMAVDSPCTIFTTLKLLEDRAALPDIVPVYKAEQPERKLTRTTKIIELKIIFFIVMVFGFPTHQAFRCRPVFKMVTGLHFNYLFCFTINLPMYYLYIYYEFDFGSFEFDFGKIKGLFPSISGGSKSHLSVLVQLGSSRPNCRP